MATKECPFCQQLDNLRELPDDDLVWQFPHSVALLGPWQFYQGYCILIARRHATELFQLSPQERGGYLEELTLLARAVSETFGPHKLNYELLGNQVPHLHWHVFPRSLDDPDRLRPVWLRLDRAEHDDAERQRLQTGSLNHGVITARLRETLTRLTRTTS